MIYLFQKNGHDPNERISAMILADKIIDLRKKNGLSQEELAEKMNVSRQSVSKWEGAQSVPDLNKIIMMSEIFGVTTDYLLKDSIDKPEFSAQEESDETLRRVSMEEANAFLSANLRYAGRVSVGVLLCILSFIILIASGWLAVITELEYIADIGAAVMFGIVGAAVWIFISSASLTSEHKYLESEPIDTAYGVDGMVSERRAEHKSRHNKSIATGVMLYFFAIVFMIVFGVLNEQTGNASGNICAVIGVCGMLALAAAGISIMVKSSIIMSGFSKLLEEDGYSREKKQAKGSSVNIVMIYWLAIVAAFLAVTLIARWHLSWIIFVVGGVLTPVVTELQKLGKKR